MVQTRVQFSPLGRCAHVLLLLKLLLQLLLVLLRVDEVLLLRLRLLVQVKLEEMLGNTVVEPDNYFS